MRILVVVGTRPEAIKLAPVILKLKLYFTVQVCASGQHQEMLHQALDVFSIRPDVQLLPAMQADRSLNQLSAALISQLDDVLQQFEPDWVFVQGDTTTAFCAALAAFHRQVPVAHVEAGLRTGDMKSPFPEEANRSLISRIAQVHFAPTKQARLNLVAEGIGAETIKITGNTVVDSVDWVTRTWRETKPVLNFPLDEERPLVLFTTHRRENFGDVMRGICRALRTLCETYADHQWVFPVHLNPAVRTPVFEELDGIDNLFLIDPVDYVSSLYLISKSSLIVSDSGGIQEEAPYFSVPVIVMRNHTERYEGIERGFSVLAGQDPEKIVQLVKQWLDHPAKRQSLLGLENPYGDGKAAARILQFLQGEPVAEFNA
jgi:UDP-N-acetylglucosamine 2-epimerase (non-hydrolysing)